MLEAFWDFVLRNLHWILITHIVLGTALGLVAYLILLERKTASWVQDRLGPNRVGPHGLLQPFADGLKFFFKEDYRPLKVDRVLYTIAPMIMILVVMVAIAIIPWGGIKGERVSLDVTGVMQRGGTVAVAEAVRRNIAAGDRLPPHQMIGSIDLEHHYRSSLASGSAPAAAVETYQIDSIGNRVGLIGARGPVGPRVEPDVRRLRPEYDVRLAAGSAQPGDRVYANYTHGWYFQGARLNIGVLFVLATLSLAVYGIVIGGWASNNKYSFLGGLRATANMISYEIPLGLSVICIVLMFGTLDLGTIVAKQSHYMFGFIPAWNVFTQPLTFLLYLICIHAEANRAPFDLAEAEQELVGGYHTEYSSMRFALFFLAEYFGMIVTSAVGVALFFGGWHVPFLGGSVDPTNPAVTDNWIVLLLRPAVFFGKTILVLFVFMWVRWSLPRFRFDQLMQIAWRGLIPISLLLTAGTVMCIWITRGSTVDGVTGPTALWFLAMNLAVVVLTMAVYRLIPRSTVINRRVKLSGSRYSAPLQQASA